MSQQNTSQDMSQKNSQIERKALSRLSLSLLECQIALASARKQCPSLLDSYSGMPSLGQAGTFLLNCASEIERHLSVGTSSTGSAKK